MSWICAHCDSKFGTREELSKHLKEIELDRQKEVQKRIAETRERVLKRGEEDPRQRCKDCGAFGYVNADGLCPTCKGKVYVAPLPAKTEKKTLFEMVTEFPREESADGKGVQG